MLRNLLNRNDFTGLARKSRLVVPRLLMTDEDRTRETWDNARVVRGWTDLPGYEERFCRMVSGDPSIDHRQYVAREYLAQAGLRALSLGCGRGLKEIAWARTGSFDSILGVDLSTASINEARSNASTAGFDNVLSFRVANIDELEESTAFDVLIIEQALHHFSNLPRVVETIRRLLKPDGYLVINEYVGARRFQWPSRQVAMAQELLSSLPEWARIKGSDGSIVERVWRPSRLAMRLMDPSEAIESDRILPTLAESMELLELRPFGGSILHLVFVDIAQNLMDGSKSSEDIANRCFEYEDRALSQGLESDFVIAVYCNSCA